MFYIQGKCHTVLQVNPKRVNMNVNPKVFVLANGWMFQVKYLFSTRICTLYHSKLQTNFGKQSRLKVSCWRGSFEWRQIGFFPWTFVSISSSSFERFFKVFFFQRNVMHACSFIIYEVVFYICFCSPCYFLELPFLKLLRTLVFVICQTHLMYGYQLNEAEVFFPITNWATSWVQLATDSVLWRQPLPYTTLLVSSLNVLKGTLVMRRIKDSFWRLD